MVGSLRLSGNQFHITITDGRTDGRTNSHKTDYLRHPPNGGGETKTNAYCRTVHFCNKCSTDFTKPLHSRTVFMINWRDTKTSHSRTPQLRHLSLVLLGFPLMPFCADDQSFPPCNDAGTCLSSSSSSSWRRRKQAISGLYIREIHLES